MKDILKKYLTGSISEVEREKIRKFLVSHSDEMENYFSEDEWNKEEYASVNNCLLPENLIHDFLKSKKKKAVVKKILYLSASVAACAVVFITANNYFSVHENSGNPVAASIGNPVIYTNELNVNKKILLPDSTSVTMFPHSEIRLAANYNQQTRDIDLTGEAIFFVHKNPQRRFTVFSGNVATTAVGTIFHVTNNNSRNVCVQLIEGKIIVKEKGNDANTYYLLPGKGIAYENKTHHFSLLDDAETAGSKNPSRHNAQNLDVVSISGKYAATGNTPNNINISHKNTETFFSDVMLSDVFRELAKDYNVRIAFPVTKASSIRFAGNVDKAQDIKKILSDIAVMNDFRLQIDSAKNTFTFY